MKSHKRIYKAGIRRGASISPRQAYRKGLHKGIAVQQRKNANQAHYYYEMGKNSR